MRFPGVRTDIGVAALPCGGGAATLRYHKA